MLNWIAEGFIFTGACVLAGALFPVNHLVKQLPPGQVRRRWVLLTALIVCFILGYLSYAALIWGQPVTSMELIVSGVFLLGAGFVWLTATLALQTAVDIRRVTLLEQENITDPLMGIYNRRYLDRRLEEEFARARRYGLPLSLVMVDIDHFKRVNDLYGHQVGDLVLKYLGELVLHAVRETDIIARYGGEELVIIAPNTLSGPAALLADRLRQHIEAHDLVVSSQTNQRLNIRITVSAGVGSLHEGDSDCLCLIHRADDALYQAKQEGRNRVSVFDSSTTRAAAAADCPV
jgi:diguanylate cyclase (GGDEF)-like protein